MEIDWNIPPELLQPDDASSVAAKLEEELKRFVKPKEEVTQASENSELPEKEDAAPDFSITEPAFKSSLSNLEAIYEAQALHQTTIHDAAKAIGKLLSPIKDIRVRASILGSVIRYSCDHIPLIVAAYEVECAASFSKGERVFEVNGAAGTVISVLSFDEVVVKWDEEPRAMRALTKHLVRSNYHGLQEEGEP